MSLQSQLESILRQEFNAAMLVVNNESHMHSVPKESETHFKVIVVDDSFEGLNLLSRHRKVQSLLKDITPRVRAIALHTFTQQEWKERQNTKDNLLSPPCAGGSKNLD